MNDNDPHLFHRIKGQKSILVLLVSDDKIYAGTQGGDLLVWSLESFELLHTIHAHKGSLLGLCLSADKKLLFSSGGDAIVNVWCTKSFIRLYSIYSRYDVGDVFCVSYSSELQNVYLGAQNTSLQWYDLSAKDSKPPPDPTAHPSYRNHRFFDSKGPTGISTPRSASPFEQRALGGQDLEIDKDHIVQYAHYGYVYCTLLATGLPEYGDANEVLISGGGDGVIKLWSLDCDDGAILTDPVCLENGDESILTIALDGTLLYSGRLEGDINVWDLDTRQLIRRIKAHTDDILSLAAGHDLIFCGGAGGITKIFNSRHQNTSEWKAHERLVLASAVASYRSREIYVTGGNDGCIAIWDISECFDRPPKRSLTSNEELVTSLERLVSYPTVSSKPEYAQDCRRGASFLRSLFKRFGAETELLSTEDHRNPIVFSRFRGKYSKTAKSKTILFYGHYDVVEAENKNNSWHADPFRMQGINGYLYGRGVSDNKGPVLAAMYAVADIVLRKQLRADIVFLIEGEEESGSRGFEKAIQNNKSLVGKVDWILLANSYWLTDDIPCLTYGLRGVIRTKIEVNSDLPDLHSGVDGSRLISEPLKDLVALLAKLTGSAGEITIPGFYDCIPQISDVESQRFERICRTLLRQNPDLKGSETLTESLKARWREPSLTIHYIQNSGPSNSTIISRCAAADISIRLVPNQTVAAIQHALQQTLNSAFERMRSSNTLTIKSEHCAEPWLGDPNNKVFRTLEEAIMEVWEPVRLEKQTTSSPTSPTSNGLSAGLKSPKLAPATSSTLSSLESIKGASQADQVNRGRPSAKTELPSSQVPQKPLYIREGGSIPAIRFLEQEFNAPAAHLPCGQASDKAHLSNERLRLLNLYKSREIFRKVFLDLPLK